MPDIGYSVSFTTRQMRAGEENGRDYFFVKKENFSDLIEQNEFLEFAEVHGNFYGTSVKRVKAETELGRDIILEIDVQGAASIRRLMPEAVSIFIMPPSYQVLERRLTTRATEKQNDLSVRLRNSFGEVHRYTEFEYIIINDDAAVAAANLQTVILAERLKRIRQNEAVRVILDSFDVSILNTFGE